ncbi:lipase [Actinotalea sp. AC32]|nr:lipase [Actinotalea sp. AC32]
MLTAARVGLEVRRTWWRVRDYAYVLHRQAVGVLVRGGPEVYLDPDPREHPDVVLVPGVYESWQFLRPLADELHARGHAVHVLPALGYNRGPVESAAAVLGAHLRSADLRDVVVVAHSKGGLIGKLAMLRHDPERRIARMLAVATPFGGSSLARLVPLRAVRAFLPTDPTIAALAVERSVNARITSAYSHWDPHIPAGSVLPGARDNVELATPGHFRVLTDPRLVDVVLAAVRAEAAQADPPADPQAPPQAPAGAGGRP